MKVSITSRYDEKTHSSEIERRHFTNGERLTRTAKVSGALLLAGFFTVFIPILHFILPPIFLVLSLVFGIATWTDRSEIVAGGFTCPYCQTENSLKGENDKFPREQRCEKCQLTIALTEP